MPAEDEFGQLMEEAEAAAWRKSNAFTSRLQTSVRFTARKAIRKSPAKVIKFLVGRVPVVGSALGFGVEKISEKIRKKRVKAAVFKHQVGPSTPAGAKAMSKSLADMGTNIDKNITKQEAAYRDLVAAMERLNVLSIGPGATTALDWVNAFKNAAYAYYRVDHYNVKLADLVEQAQWRLERLEEWAEEGTDFLVTGKEELWKAFEERYEDFVDDNVPLLGVGRARSSSSA
jgi:protein-tyrosine-phosphatase